MNWSDLKFWSSGEYQVIQERLDDLYSSNISYCPNRANLFKSMEVCPLEDVRIAILGQDPYPDQRYATGIAFSIPTNSLSFPATLVNIFKEYQSDLHYPLPTSGDLTPWCKQGVFMWNVIPTCEAGKPLSHQGWVEYANLNKEILGVLKERHCVVAALGAVARSVASPIIDDLIVTSHPSPRGSLNSKTPFRGSRLFTTINSKLQGKPIEWRLT